MIRKGVRGRHQYPRFRTNRCEKNADQRDPNRKRSRRRGSGQAIDPDRLERWHTRKHENEREEKENCRRGRLRAPAMCKDSGVRSSGEKVSSFLWRPYSIYQGMKKALKGEGGKNFPGVTPNFAGRERGFQSLDSHFESRG